MVAKFSDLPYEVYDRILLIIIVQKIACSIQFTCKMLHHMYYRIRYRMVPLTVKRNFRGNQLMFQNLICLNLEDLNLSSCDISRFKSLRIIRAQVASPKFLEIFRYIPPTLEELNIHIKVNHKFNQWRQYADSEWGWSQDRTSNVKDLIITCDKPLFHLKQSAIIITPGTLLARYNAFRETFRRGARYIGLRLNYYIKHLAPKLQYMEVRNIDASLFIDNSSPFPNLKLLMIDCISWVRLELWLDQFKLLNKNLRSGTPLFIVLIDSLTSRILTQTTQSRSNNWSHIAYSHHEITLIKSFLGVHEFNI